VVSFTPRGKSRQVVALFLGKKFKKTLAAVRMFDIEEYYSQTS
jgi:hypothetical protein